MGSSPCSGAGRTPRSEPAAGFDPRVLELDVTRDLAAAIDELAPMGEDGAVKVTVAAFGAMRQYMPDGSGRTELEVGSGSCVGDVVDALGAPRRMVFAVLIDGVRAALDQEVHDSAEVTVMPPFAGG